MKGAVCTLVLLFFGVGVNGWNPFNRTKTNMSDASTKFDEAEAEAEGDLEDAQIAKTVLERILGETPTEVDAYRVSSIAKKAVQTKKVLN